MTRPALVVGLLLASACGKRTEPVTPEVVAAAQNHPQRVVIAGGYAYWTVYGNLETDATGAIRQIPGAIARARVSGDAIGPLEIVHDNLGHPNHLFVVGDELAWFDRGTFAIAHAPLAGGAPADAWSIGDAVDAMTVDGKTLYWTRPERDRYRIVRAAIGQTPETVGDVPGVPTALAVIEDHVYVATSDPGDARKGAIYRVAQATLDAVATEQDRPSALANLRGRLVWTTSGDDRLVAAPDAKGGAPEVLAVFPKGSNPSSIAVDGDDLFVTTADDGAVWHLRRGGEPSKLAAGDLFAEGVTVDQRYVYWANNGTAGSILRTARVR